MLRIRRKKRKQAGCYRRDVEDAVPYGLKFSLSDGDKRDRTAVVCMPERLSKVLDKEKTPTFRLELVEISGIEPLLFVCLKDSQDKEKSPKSYDFEDFWWR